MTKEMGMITFMVASLVNDDSWEDYPFMWKYPADLYETSTLADDMARKLWVGFMVRAYADSLNGKA